MDNGKKVVEQHIKEDKVKNTAEVESKDSTSTGKKKRSVRFKVFISIASVLLAVVLVGGAYLWHLLGMYDHKDFSKEEVTYQKEEFDTDDSNKQYEIADPDSIIWEKYGNIKKVDGITNILLCAEENQDSGKRGRADVIIIATLNTNDDSIKLTSIMRDTYVQIPGYKDNRINVSYRTGDIPLLEDTIKENFNIELDGYIKVDFDSFTNVIDELGGVPVNVTKEEAEWLNESNHILDPKSRNLTAGLHMLNGSQALGYSRIRHVKTAEGLHDDFGRVWRQKHVLLQVFNEYKKQSLLDILGMAPELLSLVQTDLSKTEVLSLVKTVMDLKIDKIETLAIPVKDGFSPKKIRGMDVLVPDLQVNNDAFSQFIYGTSGTETVSNSHK